MTKQNVLDIIGELDYEVLKEFFVENFKVSRCCWDIIDIVESNPETEQKFQDYMLTQIAENYKLEEFETDWKEFME